MHNINTHPYMIITNNVVPVRKFVCKLPMTLVILKTRKKSSEMFLNLNSVPFFSVSPVTARYS